VCGSLCPDLRRSGVRSDVRSGVRRSDLLPAARSVLRAGQLLQAPVQALPAEVPPAEAAPLLPSEVLPRQPLLQRRSGLLRSGRSVRPGVLRSGCSELLCPDVCRSDELLPLIVATLEVMLVTESRPM
jgi:hypothetical protein